MMTPNHTKTEEDLFFITLKISKHMADNEFVGRIFDQRAFSDILVKALVYLIDRCQVKLFGFVILSDQIHIIADTDDALDHKLTQFKRISEREILKIIGRKLAAMDERTNRNQMVLRRAFVDLLNEDEPDFWEKSKEFLPIHRYHLNNEVVPITSNDLLLHLADEKRNYLQLGANAFTRVMIKAI